MYMYCPQCNRKHNVDVVTKSEVLQIHNETVIVLQKHYYCPVKDMTYDDGTLLNENLYTARKEYYRKKHLDEPKQRPHLYKGLRIGKSNEWIEGDLSTTVYYYSDGSEKTVNHISHIEFGMAKTDEETYEPDYQAGLDEPVYSETVSEYTGYCDTNDIKIFENDFIRVTRTNRKDNKRNVFWYLCVYRDGMFLCLNLKNETKETVSFISGLRSNDIEDITVEVSGNLFDNYFLIKGKQ